MKKNYILYIFSLLLVIGILTGCSELASTNNDSIKGIKAKVTSVTDGDTIEAELENGLSEKVRLILVDTPETKHPRLGLQPFGNEASQFTSKALTGKEVTLELDVEERDRYGRLLAYVWVDNTLFNEILLKEGLARLAIYPPNTKYVDRFKEIQQTARSSGIGIWSIEDYVQEDGYYHEGINDSPPPSTAEPVPDKSTDTSDDKESILRCAGKIKGNANSKIYHVPDGRYYSTVTDNIVWFCSEKDAQLAGYRKSKQ